jgi:hypothetical protein
MSQVNQSPQSKRKDHPTNPQPCQRTNPTNVLPSYISGSHALVMASPSFTVVKSNKIKFIVIQYIHIALTKIRKYIILKLNT